MKAKQLKPLYQEVQELSESFSSFRVQHVPRADNASADLLANAALDGRDDIPSLFVAAVAPK